MNTIVAHENHYEKWANQIECDYIGCIDYDLRDHTYQKAANRPTKRSILLLFITFPEGDPHTNFLLFYNSHVYRIEPHGRTESYDEEYLDNMVREEYPNHTYHSTKSYCNDGPQSQENANGWLGTESHYGFKPLGAYCFLWAMITTHLFLESLRRKIPLRASLKELECTQQDLHEYWATVTR